MKIRISNSLTLTDVPPLLSQQIRDRLTFLNPAYLEAEKMGRWLGKLSRHLFGYQERDGALILPRGFIGQVIAMAHNHGAELDIEDRTRTLPEVAFTFNGTLKPFQEEAVTEVLQRDFGVLCAPTGSGKTVMALAVIAARRQPALIVVHSKELVNQWVARIETFLKIPARDVGVIGSGKQRMGDQITVALVQSLYKCAEDVAPRIGFLIADEVQRCPSRCFSEAVTAFDSRYMLGLSATPWRRDGLSRLIYWYLGDLAHEIDAETLQQSGDILRADVVWRETAFRTSFDPSEEYSKMLSELTQDPERNALIASDVAGEARNGGGVCLVLSDRKAHCEAISGILAEDYGINAAVLTGDLGSAQRQAVLERLQCGAVKVLVATGQLIGEGFDAKELSTLFLATPIRFDGRVIQYLGRVLRPAPGKDRARVFDYADLHVGPLRAAARARSRLYDATGGNS